MHVEFMRDEARQMPLIPDPLSVESLKIWHCKYKTLAPIAACGNLKTLTIASYPDETLNLLGPFRDLKVLHILHLPKIHDLTPLRQLSALVSLSLETSPGWDASGKQTQVLSLEPVASLPQLQHLQLFGVVPRDKSLSALEFCESLVTARFQGYPPAEVARFFNSRQVKNAFAP
jgi:hypothetical protein